MDDSEKTSLKNAVIKAMTEMKSGTVFYGTEFQKAVANYYPKAKRKYTETILRVARRYCRSDFKCLEARKSKYMKVGK